MGVRAPPTTEIIFDNVDCSVFEGMVGKEGGFQTLMKTLEAGRANHRRSSPWGCSRSFRMCDSIRQGEASFWETTYKTSGDPIHAGRYGNGGGDSPGPHL